MMGWVRRLGLAALFTGSIGATCLSSDEDTHKRHLMREAGIPQGIYSCEKDGLEYELDTSDRNSEFFFKDRSFRFKDMKSGELVDLKGARCNPIDREEKDDMNWVALQVWDSFYDLNLDKTLPENLMSLEIGFELHPNYIAMRKFKDDMYGDRSTVGHYMVELHLSKEFLEKNKIDREKIGDDLFLFPDRDSDMFFAWGGEVNLRDFVLYGVSGLANPLKDELGNKTGSFHGFRQALIQGDADFEGGWFVTDKQALGIISSIRRYRGLKEGYTFVSRAEVKPNRPYEREDAQGTNGDNCIDFALTSLADNGVIDRQEAEDQKVCLNYPEHFWDSVIPLEGVGKKVYDEFSGRPDVPMYNSDLLKLGWYELFFSGVEFFDDAKLMRYIRDNEPKYNCVRIWEQTKSIEWLKTDVQFRSKRVVEDLLPHVIMGLDISDPFPVGPDRYRFRDSEEYMKWKSVGDRMLEAKMKKAGLVGPDLESFKSLEERLKSR